MSSLTLSVDLSDLLDQGQIITRDILPRVHEAVGAITLEAKERWADKVMKARGVWSEEKKRYVESLKWEYTGDFSARVWADYKFADEIDTGRPARDLKRMLDTSLKVRIVGSGRNAGKRYLIIPMRHNTPGASNGMPVGVYQQAIQLAPSSIIGRGRRLSGTGAFDTKTRKPLTVNQNKYNWGDRLDTAGMNELSKEQQRRLNGMVRFDSSGLGGKQSSTYLTFRVMMEGSPGWIVPAKPGLQLLPAVVSELQPKAEQIFAMAVQLDLGGSPALAAK